MQINFNAIPDKWGNSGIYIILNKINNKCYVGSSINIKKRWYEHKLKLNLNEHYNSYLQASWNKYGKENFIFKLIEVCKTNLAEREQFWMNESKCYIRQFGYNARPTSNNNTGYVWTPEQLENLSRAKKGFKHTEEAKDKMRFKKPKMSERMMGNTYNKGRKYSDIEKIEVAKRPRKFDKWPHELGSKCKCEECKQKWRDYWKSNRIKKKTS